MMRLSSILHGGTTRSCIQRVNSRKMCTSSSEKAARLLRRQALDNKTVGVPPPNSSLSNHVNPKVVLAASIALAAVGGAVYDWSRPDSILRGYYKNLMGSYEEIFMPSKEKLLPDWPTDPAYAASNIPLDAPCPPLLILDVEKTLIGSEHDARNGWRFAKRPGVDKLIRAMEGYYEIVLFSERDLGMVFPILEQIDPEVRCHKMGSGQAQLTEKNKYLKRLDFMNRDVRKIVLIDDDPEAFEGFERNTLCVKPYEDIRDKTDSVLLDLIPLLQGLVHHDTADFREALDDLGTHAAEEAVIEYQMRIAKKKEEERQKRNKGLGALLRSQSGAGDDVATVRSLIPSPSQLVGGTQGDTATLTYKGANASKDKETAKPAVVKKKGALFSLLSEAEREKEEHERAKMEKMNELAQRRVEEKRKRDEKRRAQEQRKQEMNAQ